MSAATLQSEPPSRRTTDADLQRVRGEIRLGWTGDRLAELYQQSPCRVLFPYRAVGAGPEAVLINTAGGLAGGDRLSIAVRAEGDAGAVVTSQAAEKLYRALDRPAEVRTAITVAAGASLEWLPQETIAFDGARLDRTTSIALAGGARLLALEMLALGRQASGLPMQQGSIRDRWRVRLDGRLHWLDSLRLDAPVDAAVGRPSLLGGHTAVATVLLAGPGAEAALEPSRAVIDGHGLEGGASCLGPLLICRVLSPNGQRLRQCLAALVSALRVATGRPAGTMPRVWGC